MKKSLFFVAAAALFAACSSDSENVDVPTLVNNADAISFSAYTGSAVTRGTVNTLSAFNENGIGVFAFYQPAINGTAQQFNTYKYAAPDFMYNQQVTPNVVATYTDEDAKAYNAALSGAVKKDDVQTPAQNYTTESANAHNNGLAGAITQYTILTDAQATTLNGLSGASKSDYVAGNQATAEDAQLYNNSLTDAVTTSDVEFAEVKYTEETAAAYNANLTGAIKAGKVYGSVWSYSPVKYWPNNTNDQVSFFAYAPYDPNKTWEDMNIKTDVRGTTMSISCPIYSDVKAQEDYLFASPRINITKQATNATGNTYDASYNNTTNVCFDFKHITSQVNLFVGVEQDAANQTPTAWTDANTDIKVESIVFKSLGTGFTYTYDLTSSPATETVTTSATTQDIELTSANFVDAAATINTTNYAVAGFKQLNTVNDVMFLAPQTLTQAIITYTVTTKATDDLNASTITNKITADLSSLTLEAGKSYKLDFLIGMNSVKVVASLTDWVDGGTTQYNVPANE